MAKSSPQRDTARTSSAAKSKYGDQHFPRKATGLLLRLKVSADDGGKRPNIIYLACCLAAATVYAYVHI